MFIPLRTSPEESGLSVLTTSDIDTTSTEDPRPQTIVFGGLRRAGLNSRGGYLGTPPRLCIARQCSSDAVACCARRYVLVGAGTYVSGLHDGEACRGGGVFQGAEVEEVGEAGLLHQVDGDSCPVT